MGFQPVSTIQLAFFTLDFNPAGRLADLRGCSGEFAILRNSKPLSKLVLPASDVSFCAWQWQVIAQVRGNVVPW